MTTVAMSYDALAERLGISVPSARRLVQRRRWTKVVGNQGRAVVTVPMEFLAQRGERDDDNINDNVRDVDVDVVTDVATTSTPSEAPSVNTTDITMGLLERLTTIQAEMAETARKLGMAEGELRAVRDERDHLRLLLDRHQRPWWRRVVGA